MSKMVSNKTTYDGICHYTNINALVGILQNKEIVLRVTNVLYLNDTHEVKEGVDLLKQIIQKIVGRNSKNFRSIAQILRTIYKGFVDFYAVSFCKYKDDLAMWRMYADNGMGCALEFDNSTIKDEYDSKDNSSFIPCSYEEDNANDFWKETLKCLINKSNGDEFSSKFIEACLSIKNKAYKGENEWRIVYHHCNKNKEKKVDVKFRVKNNYVVPYIEIVISKKALKQIILGPNTNELTLKSVENLLRINGYTGVTVTKSKLPYRG